MTRCHDGGMQSGRVNALLVEDHGLTRTLLASAMSSMGLNTAVTTTFGEAKQLIEDHEMQLLVTDLDLGIGPTGVELAAWAQQRDPSLGVVLLSAYRSTYLVDSMELPASTRRVHLVKEDIDSSGTLIRAIEFVLNRSDKVPAPPSLSEHVITRDQADVLRLMAHGLSNSQIASERDSSVSSVENLLRRMYTALGLVGDDSINPRSAAIAMYRQSMISVS